MAKAKTKSFYVVVYNDAGKSSYVKWRFIHYYADGSWVSEMSDKVTRFRTAANARVICNRVRDDVVEKGWADDVTVARAAVGESTVLKFV